MNPILTRIGWADFGDYDHFGLRLYRDLLGSVSYTSLCAFALTGRRIASVDAALLDDIATAAHVPEPRIWPAKIGRLVASCGRSMTGYLAGCVVLDGDVLGGTSAERAATLIVQANAAIASSNASAPDALRAFVRARRPWPTTGVQQRNVDERVTALRACVERRGLSNRPHWSTATMLWDIVREEHGLGPTIFEAVAAASLDVGFSPHETGALTPLLLQPQFLAHAFDAERSRAQSASNDAAVASLRKLEDTFIRYVGPAARTLSRP